MITNIKKARLGYLVTIDDHVYKLEEDILVSYRLSKGLELSKKQLDEILQSNELALIKRKALTYLKVARSTKAFKTYLRSINANEQYIETLTKSFKERGYLDDQLYAKMMIEQYMDSKGNLWIKAKLIEKGIHKDIIEKLLPKTNQNTLTRMVQKAIESNKKPNYIQAKIQITRQLISKGFVLSDFESILDRGLKQKSFSTDSLKNDYLKLQKKYDKMPFNEQAYKIKRALFQKGYKIEEIDKILEEMGKSNV